MKLVSRCSLVARNVQARGQGMVEYMLVTAIVTLVMFIPNPLTNNTPPADFLARAVRSFFRGYSFLISVF